MTDILDTPEMKTDASFRAQLHQALYAPAFERFITVLILVNALILGALTYQYHDNGLHGSWVKTLITIDVMIVSVFAAEMTLKVYADGRGFFRSGWNIFDLIVVTAGMFGSGYPLTIIRSLRVLRTLRLVTRVPSMKVVVESFLRSLPGIGSVLTVMLLIIFIYSVVGTQLFRGIAPELFGSLHESAFTLFTVLTLEGWPDVAREVMPHSPFAGSFFVSYIALNSFVVLNLMIAVIINSMHKEYDAHAEEEREDILEEIRALRAELKIVLDKKTSV